MSFHRGKYDTGDERENVISYLANLESRVNGLEFGRRATFLSSTWYDPSTFKTSTSSSFANVASIFWYMYHPTLRVTCICKADFATTGELRVMEPGGSQQAIIDIPPDSTTQLELLVSRSNTTGGSGHSGTKTILDVEFRRTGGSGTVYALVAEVTGVDLS